jgi:putative hemolysin
MSKYDFYDHEKAEKLREEYSRMMMDIYRRYHAAKEKGNQLGMERAVKALRKHKAKGEQLKEWAEEAGFCWY